MLYALLGTFIGSFTSIFWTKSLKYRVGVQAHTFVGFILGIVILLYFLVTGDYYKNIDLILVAGMLIITIFDHLIQIFRQEIFRREKISFVTPYTNIHKIVVICISFFVFNDVSFITLMITVLTIIIIALFSIDYKTFKIPNSLPIILIEQSLASITILLSGYFILKYGAIEYFHINIIIGTLSFLAIGLYLGQIQKLIKAPKEYWKYRLIGCFGMISWFLSLIIIKDLGISLSILLSFIEIVMTLIFSYIILNDVPTKKSIAMTIIVSLLIGIGYYFK